MTTVLLPSSIALSPALPDGVRTATYDVDRPVPEIAFIFHATCQGLATNELLRERPPVGVGMWAHTRDLDPIEMWTRGLGALVRGLAPVAET